MTKINQDDKVLTLINTFDVDPENQQELLDLLVEATIDVMQHIDGFISANLHKSLDGKNVANYAQWKSVAHFEAMLQNQDAQVHMAKAAKIATKYSPKLYQVEHTTTVGS
jgi:quinol monooxygenase YgiN